MDTKGKYYCPMRCEGEKTYEQPGDCPVCNMHLIPVDELHEKDEKQIHDHHHHAAPVASKASGKYYCPMHCEGDKTYDQPGDCPVCGMHLKKEEAGTFSHQTSDKKIYTCPMHPEVRSDDPATCTSCGMALEPLGPTTRRTLWTCPMHPEVVRDEPGDCPVCGMPLVPAESLGYKSADVGEATVPLVIPATAPLITGKRAVVYGEEDLVVGITSFLAEIGIHTVLCASGGKSGKFEVFHNLLGLFLDTGSGQLSGFRIHANLARSIYQIIYLDCR